MAGTNLLPGIPQNGVPMSINISKAAPGYLFQAELSKGDINTADVDSYAIIEMYYNGFYHDIFFIPMTSFVYDSQLGKYKLSQLIPTQADLSTPLTQIILTAYSGHKQLSNLTLTEFQNMGSVTQWDGTNKPLNEPMGSSLLSMQPTSLGLKHALATQLRSPIPINKTENLSLSSTVINLTTNLKGAIVGRIDVGISDNIVLSAYDLGLIATFDEFLIMLQQSSLLDTLSMFAEDIRLATDIICELNPIT